MTLYAVLIAILQLCSLQLLASARPTCRLQGDRVVSAHHLLRDLGGDFPAHCLLYNTNISFPDSAFPSVTANHTQCRKALWVVYESLKEAWLIFDDMESPVGEDGVTWDKEKLDRFQNLQDQLVEEGSCLEGVDSSGVLSLYFSNVTSLLQQQDSASCGWMVLKRDLLGVLMSAVDRHPACFSWRKPR